LNTSVLMSKAVITTNNITMNDFVVGGQSSILINMGYSTSFLKAIELIINDEINLKKIEDNINRIIVELGSPQGFTK